MEFQYFGANCVRLMGKKFSVVIDDNLDKLGLKTVVKPTDIYLRTSALSPEHQSGFSAEMPGEYEVSGAIVQGIAARGHMDKEGTQNSVIYTIEADDIRVVVLGHIFPDLSDDQIEKIDGVDVLIVPVGNSGYTMDGAGALALIKKIEPKVVIPTHYADRAVKYEVAQVELAEAIKELGMEPSETVDKYKIRPGELADSTKLVILNRS